jgi:hypothetical protein
MARHERAAGNMNMMKTFLALRSPLIGIPLVTLVLAVFTSAPPAVADDGDCSATGSIASCLGEKNGTIDVTGQERRQGRLGTGGRSRQGQPNLEAAAMVAFCQDAAANATAATTAAAFTEIVPLCHGFAALPVTPPTRGQVFTAFRELALYKGAVRTDPRTFTLVNLETYFWCADTADRGCDLIGEGERAVTLLGQPVRIRPRIISYAWDFGDGTGQEITTGRAAHTYQHAMVADVNVTLTWTADYAVGAGAFQPIGDTTTTTSPVRALPVREAESVIVAGG